MSHPLSKSRRPLALIVALLAPWLAVHAAPITLNVPAGNAPESGPVLLVGVALAAQLRGSRR